MKLVVGLGNPGQRYAGTRHNIGFRVVERFAARLGVDLGESRFGGRFGRGVLPGIEPCDIGILEPQTYMNLSGDCVCDALLGLQIVDPGADLLVVFDDVDLPVGRLRVRPRGGAGGHRGLGHIIECLGRNDFPRIRFGVARPPDAVDTSDHVLSCFGPEEERLVGGRVKDAADAIAVLLREGVEAAMNRFNPDPDAEPDVSESPDEPLVDSDRSR